MSHWENKDGSIMAYVSSAGEWCSEIATIINNRSVNQLLQYANLGENAESIVDKLLGGNITSEASAISLLKAYVNLTITLTPGDKNPPLEKNMLVDSLIEIDRLNDRIEVLESQLKASEALMNLACAELEAYVTTKKFFEAEQGETQNALGSEENE